MSKKRAEDPKESRNDATTARPAAEPMPENQPATAPKAQSAAAIPSEAVRPEAAATPGTARPPAPPVAGAPLKIAALRTALGRRVKAAAPVVSRAWPTAAALVCAIGLGWAGGAMHAADPEPATLARSAELDARLGQMTEELRALREMASAAAHPQKAQPADARPMLERLDRDRSEHATRLGNLAAALERIEKQDRDIVARLAQLVEKTDHIERLTAPATTASIPAAATKPAMQPLPKPDAEALAPSRIPGWAVREVAGGLALLENPRGELVEIAPGETFRELGRVKKIERRGRKWVVLTDKGLVE